MNIANTFHTRAISWNLHASHQITPPSSFRPPNPSRRRKSKTTKSQDLSTPASHSRNTSTGSRKAPESPHRHMPGSKGSKAVSPSSFSQSAPQNILHRVSDLQKTAGPSSSKPIQNLDSKLSSATESSHRPVPFPPNSTTSPPGASFPSITSLNAHAVSQLSARPNLFRPSSAPKIKDGDLPKNYKATARRVTFTIVALPIAIVTSWVLWKR
ncbi:hypothetical protein MMC06_006093, partial [Schaereria dolodes]|nr:hypothetical protein [Schaereria dolodes]